MLIQLLSLKVNFLFKSFYGLIYKQTEITNLCIERLVQILQLKNIKFKKKNIFLISPLITNYGPN